MQPVRILHVVGKMDCGGTETMLMNYFRNINKNIVFDFIVHDKEKGFYDDEIRHLGGKIYFIPKCKFSKIISYCKNWKQFFETHKEYRVIHGHIGSTATIYLSIAKGYSLTTIAHSHSTYNRKINFHDILYKCSSFPVRFVADFFFGCSFDAGLKRYGKRIVNSSKFSIFYNAINAIDFKYDEMKRRAIREKYSIKDDVFVCGTVGRITEAKNPFFLLSIFKKIFSKNENSILLWCGKGDKEKPIKDLIEHSDIKEYVNLLGVKSNVSELMMAMDVFLFPSLFEGLGIVLIEAQATGLSCVISDSIPQEADINNSLINRLSLSESEETWASLAMSMKSTDRVHAYKYIEESNYNIVTQAKKIENFYLEIIEESFKN